MPRLPALLRRRGATAAPRERLSRDVYVLGLIAFFVMVGFGVVVPVLPVFVRSFGVGYAEVGAVVSAFALMRLVASPFVGKLIDLIGERVVLAVGIGIVAVSSGLVGIAADYPHLLILRGVGGIGSAMFTVAAMTLLLGTTSAAHRARAVGFYQGGFLIGGMTGPAIGGLLATISLTAPFFFYAGTLAVAGIVGLVLLRPRAKLVDGQAAAGVPDADGSENPLVPLRDVLRDARFRAACLANFAQGWNSFGVRSALIPVIVVEVIKGPSSFTGIAFAIAAVAQTLALGPAARFIDRAGRKPALVLALALAAVLTVAISFSGDIVTLTILLSLYGVVSAFLGIAPAASVGDVVGRRGGRGVAIFSMSSDVGAIAGPLVAGALVDAFSFPVAFGVGAVFFVAASLYSLRMPASVSAAPASVRATTKG
ncbi:MFS transporter [Agreia pratensis]|uniref:Predicted arabinose efflux permease, MFS family n=1 Tax=Agreia pratensis TaxID=150121 RepID=A0A1X7JHQ0_9MICO|nr:MFS transporter [Agreia pratensis]SMG27597.1 Predicted arabinose efflux permease, MFS family [Agreia pratensis]